MARRDARTGVIACPRELTNRRPVENDSPLPGGTRVILGCRPQPGLSIADTRADLGSLACFKPAV